MFENITQPDATAKRKVAIVVADGFEQVELEVPRKALEAAGFATEIVSPVSASKVQGFHHADKGDEFPVDVHIGAAKPTSYAALLLPGGVHNPDQLRQDKRVLEFVRHFFETGKPVAAICHGPWTLIDAGVVAGRRLTSWPSIKTDLCNAGALWSDEQLVVDCGLVTSRSPQDLPAFCKGMVEEFTNTTEEPAMIAKLAELIKGIRVAMLTTRGADGTLHSRPMATQQTAFDGTLWFFTSASSLMGQEIGADQEVNLSYSDPKSNRYISVSGRGALVRDLKKAEELWTPLLKAWFSRGLSDPDLCLLRVDVERAEYWDAPSGGSFLFGLAKSLLTGRRYQYEGTEHDMLNLQGNRPNAPRAHA